MKKLLLVPAFLLVLTGCGAQKPQIMPAEAPPAPQVMPGGGAGDGSGPMRGAPMDAAVIDTDVAPITTDTSSDEILKDIDTMMDELDTL